MSCPNTIKEKSVVNYIGLLIAAVLLISGFCSNQVQAQENEEPLYLIFEFMKVDNEQETSYAETEAMWTKIHQERVKSGEIVGWDLWSLYPGGEDQGYQYLTVTLFNDPAKMFGDFQMLENAQRAYPDLDVEGLNQRFVGTVGSRDLAVRLFLEEIDNINPEFEMTIGTVASIDLMKVDMDSYSEYETAEMEIFKPFHEEMIKNGNKGFWGLYRIMSPIGSDTYASHITVNMYDSWKQVFSTQEGSGSETSFSEDMMVQRGLETRDMKWVYMATLREMVR